MTSAPRTMGILFVVDDVELTAQMAENHDTGERGLLLTVANEHGSEVEMFLPLQEVKDLALDFAYLARNIEELAEGEAGDTLTEFEHEPNREALAMEACVEPEGRWGNE